MSRLDDIEKRINDRMAEIERRINGTSGGTVSSCGGGVPPRGPVAQLAPLNPEYLDWARGIRRGGEVKFGLIPTAYDFTYLGQFAAMRRATVTLPPRFDLRERGVLSPMRDQGDYGTCWAHAALASVESAVLMQGGDRLDLSENNMANLSGFDNDYGDGGNGDMAAAYLLRWQGPVLESDDPYGHPGESRVLPAVCHLQSVRWIPPMQSAGDTSRIKEAVMSLGAVWMGYIHDNDPQAYNKQTAAYCLLGEPSAMSGGHAVAVVGWDDAFPASNFAVPPPGDGAWIVRNSWGSRWGDGGYFYVSYHDRTFGRWTPGYAYFGVEEATNYADVLQYDPLGVVSRIGNGERAAAANVFTAARDLSVSAVGFYAVVPETSYRVEIHVGCPADDPSGSAVAGSVAGTSEWPGYVTVRLPTAVSVPAGSRFSVVIELVTPGIKDPVAVECAFPRMRTSKADAAPGQSFIRLGGDAWHDLTEVERTCNFCCKAYVNYADGEPRGYRRFCNRCGTVTYTESSTGGKCRKCGAYF